MKKLLYLLVLLSVALPLTAQVEGRVSSADDGSPLSGVIITVKRDGERMILGYTRTNDEGQFQLNIEPEEELWLHFSMLSFANDSVQLRKGQSYYEIKLREQATQLKEVKVTAKAITARGAAEDS